MLFSVHLEPNLALLGPDAFTVANIENEAIIAKAASSTSFQHARRSHLYSYYQSKKSFNIVI